MFYPGLRISPISRADFSLREVLTAHYQSASSGHIVEWQSFRDASVGAVPAPLPVRWVANQLGPYRVEIDVPRYALGIPRTIDDFADKSALPHVTHLRMSIVPRYRVKTVQSLHTRRQIFLRQLQDNVMMIRHQHPVQHLPGEVFDDAVEQIDKVTTILIGAENVLTTATAPDDMNRNSYGFLSIASGHVHEKSTATVIAKRQKRAGASQSLPTIAMDHTASSELHATSARDATKGSDPFVACSVCTCSRQTIPLACDERV